MRSAPPLNLCLQGDFLALTVAFCVCPRAQESINQPFIVLTETKFSYRYTPVWARYSPHRTRGEAHANTLSP